MPRATRSSRLRARPGRACRLATGAGGSAAGATVAVIAAASHEIPAQREALVEQGDDEREREDDDRDGAGVAEQAAAELVVEVRGHRRRGADRSALRRHPDEVEQLQRADHRQEHRDADRRPEQRQRDVAERLPRRRPVDGGGLVSSLGICWSPASISTMWKPKYFHEMTKNRLYSTTSGSASHSCTSPVGTDGVEALVEQAVGAQDLAPHDAGDDLGQDVRGEEQGPQQPAGRQLGVEQHRQPEGERASAAASDSTMMTALCLSASRNSESENARRKLSRPTKSSSASNPFQSYRL